MQRKFIGLSTLCMLLFITASCNLTSTSTTEIGSEPLPDALPAPITTQPEHNIYTLFTINTHDWVFPENSAQTLNRIIDIHEEYSVPVDIYITDPVFQYYVANEPDLVERLSESDVVCISYHVRPSTPYYGGFDYIGLSDMNNTEMYDTLMAYETHALDLETGLYTDEPGGYQFMTDTIGYAPLTTGVSIQGTVGSVLAEVYRDLGAKFLVQHGTETDLGEIRYESYIRPEHKEVKLYEMTRDYTGGEDVFNFATEGLTGEKDEFINLKYHENNFYLTDTPFWPAFWTDVKKTEELEPPFNTNIQNLAPAFRSTAKQNEHWDLYETTVKYASEHADELHPINSFDLEVMLEDLLEENQ